MALSFDALAEGTDFDAPTTGKPLQIALAEIAENPDNPRTEFDAEYLAELAADIKVNNVKSPVSIRENPTGQTPWILNYGACRYRASALAGKATIPAFVDEQFTDYDAVAENEQRKNLTAMELALFIQKRKGEGDSNIDIAKKLGKDKQAITHYLALIDMPDVIAAAYREGRVTAARAIYNLVKLYAKHKKDVTKWCSANEEISYGSVRKLSASLINKKSQSDLSTRDSGDKAGSRNDTKFQKDKGAIKQNIAQFTDIPALLVSIDDKQAVIVLERKPSARGKVWVRYLNNDKVTEIKANRCTLIELGDANELENCSQSRA